MPKKRRNMKTKQIKLPGLDHPISIQRNPARVVVSVAGSVVADTRNALTPREAAYPPVEYIPLRTWIFPSWNGRIRQLIVLIKATAVTTAFPLEEIRQCGVVVPGAVSSCCTDQGARRVLSRPGR
jgi:hypothetical protein